MKLPVNPPPFTALLTEVARDPERLARVMRPSLGPAPNGRYRHWDTFRHIDPPAGLSAEEAWLGVKMARRAVERLLPLRDTEGRPFVYTLPNPALAMLHRIDRDAAGSLRGEATIQQVTGPATRDTYLFRSLVEEAITSSQLEGASTTRQVAKAMIQEGRAPRDRSERMILNNLRGLEFVRAHREAPLTPALVLELQRTLVDGTLDIDDGAGRFRRGDEHIVVSDETGRTLHTPPAAAELPGRLAQLCTFANATNDTGREDDFVPPVVRAILLHFWLAYDHPFVDGNGRTARALFYWSMARQGYWLCEFVSISRILRRARAAYARSYLYTETDDNDVTYFVLHQLRVLERAIDELHLYLRRKTGELRDAEALVRRAGWLRAELNPRQLALLHHALRHPEALYTVESHRTSHRTSYQTARTDLLSMAGLGLLEQRKRGRAFVFLVPSDLHERLAAPRMTLFPPYPDESRD